MMESKPKNHDRYATLKIFLSALIFSSSGLTSKWMPWSAITLVGVRAIVAVIELGLFRRTFKVRINKQMAFAALCVALTSLLFIMANKHTTAANAIVLQFAMPMFVIVFCAIFFGQRPTKLDIITALMVLLGVTLCFLDHIGGGEMLGNVLALASAVTYSMVFLLSRVRDCDPFDYAYLGNVFASVLALHIFFDKQVNFQDPMPWLVLIIMGLCVGTGYLFLASGMKGTSPVTSALLSNVEPVLNPIWVFLALGEKPGTTAILGSALVLLTVTAYSILKSKRKDAKPGLQQET